MKSTAEIIMRERFNGGALRAGAHQIFLWRYLEVSPTLSPGDKDLSVSR
jgi:hypothetical protein